MKLIPITINSYEDLRQATEVLSSLADEKKLDKKKLDKKKPDGKKPDGKKLSKTKEKNDFNVPNAPKGFPWGGGWGVSWGVLWLSPEEELISPKIFQLMLTQTLAENSSLSRILPQQSLYDCADSEARALQALICGSKRIIYNGTAFPTLKQLAAGYNASLQKNRPQSFLFDARARNSSRLLYSHIKNNTTSKCQVKVISKQQVLKS